MWEGEDETVHISRIWVTSAEGEGQKWKREEKNGDEQDKQTQLDTRSLLKQLEKMVAVHITPYFRFWKYHSLRCLDAQDHEMKSYGWRDICQQVLVPFTRHYLLFQSSWQYTTILEPTTSKNQHSACSAWSETTAGGAGSRLAERTHKKWKHRAYIRPHVRTHGGDSSSQHLIGHELRLLRRNRSTKNAIQRHVKCSDNSWQLLLWSAEAYVSVPWNMHVWCAHVVQLLVPKSGNR